LLGSFLVGPKRFFTFQTFGDSKKLSAIFVICVMLFVRAVREL
jgi:hypothetical protein